MTATENPNRIGRWLALGMVALLLLAAVWVIYAGPALKKRQADMEIQGLADAFNGKVVFMPATTPHWLGWGHRNIPELPRAWQGKLYSAFIQWQGCGGPPNIRGMIINEPLSSVERQKLFCRMEHFTPIFLIDHCATDTDLEISCHYSELKTLELRESAVTDAGMKNLRTLSRLQGLSLSETAVTDVGIKELGCLTELWRLDISKTAVTDVGLQELAKCRKLSTLQVSPSISTEAIAQLQASKQGCPVKVTIVPDAKIP
jgi:hypothetical protein